MRFKTELLVMGAKRAQGEYQGRTYDYTEIFHHVDLQDGENFVGQIGQNTRFGSSANFEKLKSWSYPLLCEAELEIVSNGRTTSTIILDLKPKLNKPVLAQ